MNSSREKRITLRFYLDDPIASETYGRLMQRRLETGAVMNTLIVELLHRELCQKDAMSLGELEKLFRSVIRSEGRAIRDEGCKQERKRDHPNPEKQLSMLEQGFVPVTDTSDVPFPEAHEE